ncbi:hypothetical protein Hanom_Chr06g00513831 [Helianthus anomalus]
MIIRFNVMPMRRIFLYSDYLALISFIAMNNIFMFIQITLYFLKNLYLFC